MRSLVSAALVVLSGLAVSAPVRAEQAASCLSDGELRDLVQTRTIVPQIYAFRTASGQTGGEVIRATLCPKDGGFVYRIVTLNRSGKLNHVTVDAVTGKMLDSD